MSRSGSNLACTMTRWSSCRAKAHTAQPNVQQADASTSIDCVARQAHKLSPVCKWTA
jgi:hypothetical protein